MGQTHDPAGPAPGPDGLAASLLLLAVTDRAGYATRGQVRLLVSAGAAADRVLRRGPAAAGGSSPSLATQLEQDAPATFEATAGALVAAGVLAPHTHRVLGLFPRHGHVVTDEVARSRAEQRLLGALVPGGRAPTEDGVLAAMASVAGLARRRVTLCTKAERDAFREHVNSLAAGMGPELVAVVRAMRQAYGRSGAGDSGVVFVPASDGDGYGDRGGDGGGGAGGDGGDGGGGGGD